MKHTARLALVAVAFSTLIALLGAQSVNAQEPAAQQPFVIQLIDLDPAQPVWTEGRQSLVQLSAVVDGVVCASVDTQRRGRHYQRSPLGSRINPMSAFERARPSFSTHKRVESAQRGSLCNLAKRLNFTTTAPLAWTPGSSSRVSTAPAFRRQIPTPAGRYRSYQWGSRCSL